VGSRPPAGGRTGLRVPGRLRPGPARTMQGEGSRKGVCAARGGGAALAAFPLPFPRALRRAGRARPACSSAPAGLGLEPGRFVCAPRLWVRRRARGGEVGRPGGPRKTCEGGSGRSGRSGLVKTSGGARGPEVDERQQGLGFD
jgi:hypothetical protein